MSSFIKFIGNIKNNIRFKKEFVDVPFSKKILKCSTILLNTGFIRGYTQVNNKVIRIFLKYYKGRSVITDIGCISLPGFRKQLTLTEILRNFTDKSLLIILSTPNGLMTNLEIASRIHQFQVKLQKNIDDNFLKNIKKDYISSKGNLIYCRNTNNMIESSFIQKEGTFKAIDDVVQLHYYDTSFEKYTRNTFYFHKASILRGFFRQKSILNQLSRRNYARTPHIRSLLHSYIKNICKKKKILESEILQNLYFFKYTKYFSNNQYLTFKKISSFKQCIEQINSLDFYSIFFFIFYSRQLKFSKYRYRFSLYIKYLNHLFKIKTHDKVFLAHITNKEYNMGGEPLFFVK